MAIYFIQGGPLIWFKRTPGLMRSITLTFASLRWHMSKRHVAENFDRELMPFHPSAIIILEKRWQYFPPKSKWNARKAELQRQRRARRRAACLEPTL